MRLAKTAFAVIATAAIVGLSGCGIIAVDHPGGTGECGGFPATVTVDQDVSGETLSIKYTGPANVALMAVPGLYLDDVIPIFGGGLWAWGDDGEANVIRLDTTAPAPGWSISGSGNETSYEFSGSIETLYNNVPTWFDSYGGGQAAIANSVFPVAIAIDCDSSHSTQALTLPSTDSLAVFAGWSYTAAKALYPNNMQIPPFVVLSSQATATGATATLRFSDEALAEFGNFGPQTPTEFILYPDDPDVANDSIGNLWLQAFSANGGGGSVSVTGTNPDHSFNVEITGDSGAALATGHYILFTSIPNSNQSRYKLVFASLAYDASGTVQFSSPFGDAGPTLPDTGASSGMLISLGVSGGVLVALGLGVLWVRRRIVSRSQK